MDRQSFYVKVASGARAAVKMDTPKPALRSPNSTPWIILFDAMWPFEV